MHPLNQFHWISSIILEYSLNCLDQHFMSYSNALINPNRDLESMCLGNNPVSLLSLDNCGPNQK